MAGDRHRSVNSIYQRPHRLQEEAEGAVEGSDRRRRRRTTSRRRGPSPPTSREEELEDQVAPVDESDEELVRQTDEEEGPHEDDESEAVGTGFASSDSSSSVYLRGPASSPTPSDSPRRAKLSNFICNHHYFI